MLVSFNNRLKFEIEIVHDLSCHPIYGNRQPSACESIGDDADDDDDDDDDDDECM